MKLKAKKLALPPRSEKVVLDGGTAIRVDQYTQYYKANYQQAISPAELIAEMVTNFMDSDRDFNKWLRGQENK